MKKTAHGIKLLGLLTLVTIWAIETSSIAGALPACVHSRDRHRWEQ